MRYRFRGLIRDNANPVEGHVESPSEQDAYNALSENGIVTEALFPDPKPLNLSNYSSDFGRVNDAIDSALDTSSQQVAFDQLMDRYKGKNVWVIDRDKIRSRVAQVVDAALVASGDSPDIQKIRQSVATAIQGVFSDDRNLARQRNAESIFGVRVGQEEHHDQLNIPSAPAGMPGMSLGGATAPGLDDQIQRLAGVIHQAEVVLASISAAAGRMGSGGGYGPRRMVPTGPKKEAPNEVLLEIFKANVALQKAIATPPPPPAGDAKRQAG